MQTPNENLPATILIVEDNPVSALFLIDQLRMAGYKTIAVPAVETAKLILDSAKPDLVLLGIPLPDMASITFARQLRSDPATAMLPIIALTEQTMSQDLIDDQDDNFAAYLLTSAVQSLLISTIDGVLRDHTDLP
jgi:CheY-like chemotaxis protein